MAAGALSCTPPTQPSRSPIYASLPPYGGGPAGTHATVRVVTTGGMPGWQIALIAAAAALVAATVTGLIDRARAARKMHATTA
jgi:hypothetical protein